MYIFVNKETSVIIGCSKSPASESQALADGYEIFEVADLEFLPTMIGSKLESYEVI